MFYYAEEKQIKYLTDMFCVETVREIKFPLKSVNRPNILAQYRWRSSIWVQMWHYSALQNVVKLNPEGLGQALESRDAAMSENA